MRYFTPLVALCVLFITPVYADEGERLGGSVEAEINGKLVKFPALKTDIDAVIEGDLANVTITQVFENPTNIPLHARYLFPMNKDAAVYAMVMEVGDEIIEATIKRKAEAKKTFEKAKSEGKAASLLTQHRPNMFTQKIANLVPGLPITVKLKYTQSVPKIDGAYELVVPMIVGPRYQPPEAQTITTQIDDFSSNSPKTGDSGLKPIAYGKWKVERLPEYPDVNGLTLPDTIDKERVSVRVQIKAGVAVQSVQSVTHALAVRGSTQNKIITLKGGKVIDNADFVLRYDLAGRDTQAGFLAAKDERGGFFSLLIEPPALPKDTQITPREMVFVLDTSGSMDGQPIDASKTFMRHALQNMRKGDTFRIIRFGDNASEYASHPIAATPNNIADGLTFVKSLEAYGGTNIPGAISQAFSIPEAKDTLRIVVFLTDGYIGDESQVLKQIAGTIGNARIYAFGVGAGVNRYLLAEMGRRGRGFARFIDPTEDVHDAAISLSRKLNAPVLTDIILDWGDLDVTEVTPDVIPDLFAGDSIRIQGKFTGKGKHQIKVNGNVRGAAASLPIQVKLPLKTTEGSAIPLIWARSQIADTMRHINTPHFMRPDDYSEEVLKGKVVRLGLDFSLITKWTSFVAVSRKVVNQHPELAKERNVPLPKVKGVTAKAYGKVFSGGSTPEPEALTGLMILGIMGYVGFMAVGGASSVCRKRKGIR